MKAPAVVAIQRSGANKRSRSGAAISQFITARCTSA